MRSRLFVFNSILFLSFLSKIVLAGEPLVKYEMFYLTNPATGVRLDDNQDATKFGIEDEMKFLIPGGRPISTWSVNPNKPVIGYPDDCYPEDPDNPEGNILISGRIISNFTNRPVNGAVVSIYMGAEQLRNISDGAYSFDNTKFIHGGKDSEGRLTNLYYYDITEDGYYKVFACNAYKQLSEERKQVLKEQSPRLFNNPQNPCSLDGYSGNGRECTTFDYAKAYPKFSLAVVCGMENTFDPENPSPVIGEIYSIDNYNEAYKSANPPSFMKKENLDIRVNCPDSISAFPVPMFLEYDSPANVASCRLDDISPDLQNYFTKVKQPLKNDLVSFDNYLNPRGTTIPDDSVLPDCSNPDDIFCLKNFLTKSFPKPESNKNVFDYQNNVYLDPDTANKYTKDSILAYGTNIQTRTVDLSDTGNPNENDWIALNRSGDRALEGQFDAKVDLKSYIDDYKFDLNSLKELYACFTTFNAPSIRSNAELDELNRRKFANGNADLTKEFYQNNLRIPSCRELYCGTEYVPDNTICKVRKDSAIQKEVFGIDFSAEESGDNFYQINALTGYGPGVTLNFKSLEEITNDLLVLSKELINSEFNPKKLIPGSNTLYKPVTKVSDIVACMDDNGNPVYLNDGTIAKEGSITYNYGNQTTTFFSPVPLMSFISVPYTMELFHAIEGDNYANLNRSDPSRSLLFPEQCNYDNVDFSGRKDQLFANCRKAVIPGGVYSISALRVIGNICNNVVKIPTADASQLPIGSALSGVSEIASNRSTFSNSIDIDLSIAKIGTPVSMCLCSVNDPDCSVSTSLNNKEGVKDYAISSFVGTGTQFNEGDGNKNALGFLCNNSHASPTSKEPKFDCMSKITNVDQWIIRNTPENNWQGNTDNLKVNWNYSLDDLNAGNEIHSYLTYTWGGGERPLDGNYQAYVTPSAGSTSWSPTNLSNDPTTGSVACRLGGIVDGKLTCLDPDTLLPDNQPDWGDLGLVRDPKNISSIVENRLGNINVAQTQIPDREVLENEGLDENGNPQDNVRPAIRVIQNVKDGIGGSARARFEYRNAKYDPIPELLNDFRRYSVYGAFAGDVCRTPKINSVIDIKESEFDSINTARTASLNDMYTAGIHCNTYIPEEMERCETGPRPQEWDDDARARGIDPVEGCKLAKCQQFCWQLSPTYKTVEAYRPNSSNPKGDFFCRNVGPTNGLEFQANAGDEGCILDFTSKMKQAYANPAEMAFNRPSVTGDVRYSKESYPVYNNILCKSPSLTNPLINGYVWDANNCNPFVGDQLDSYKEFQESGVVTPNY